MIGKAALMLLFVMSSVSCWQVDDAGGSALSPGTVFPGQNRTSDDYVEFYYFIKGEYDSSKNAEYVQEGIVRLREMVPETMKNRAYLALVSTDLSSENWHKAHVFGVVLNVSDVLDHSLSPKQLTSKISEYYPNPVQRKEREEIWPFIYLHQAEVAKE